MNKLLMIVLCLFSFNTWAASAHGQWNGDSNIDELVNKVVQEKMKKDKSLKVVSNNNGIIVLGSTKTPKFKNDPNCEKALKGRK